MTVARSSALLVPVLLAVASPLPASGYEVVAVTDGGTIKGKVVYQGTVPTKKIIPTKDKETCGEIARRARDRRRGRQGRPGRGRLSEGRREGKGAREADEEAGDRQPGVLLRPHVQAFPVGTVVIVNSDPVMHNTHGFYGKATVFNVALPVKGQRIERPLTKPGMMRVECDTHGWMLAWVYAADNPYYAVTRKDGTFSIATCRPAPTRSSPGTSSPARLEMPVTVKAKEAVQVPIELKKK